MSEVLINPEAIELARLTESELNDLVSFDCSDEEMNRFLNDEAYEEQDKGMNSTILLYYEGSLAAFCSVCCDAIRLSKDESRDGDIPYCKVPAIKIARLGRNTKYKNYGFGRLLIDYIKTVALELNKTILGVRFITLDAYPSKVGYYESIGFVRNQAIKNSPIGNVSMRADIYD